LQEPVVTEIHRDTRMALYRKSPDNEILSGLFFYAIYAKLFV